jgi:radical SAM-linked protein
MQADYVQRLRLTFRKFGATRYIGHLDLAQTLERALNRAKIPMAYSQGFNRRPKMQMATALPLGYTSDRELIDIWLVEQMEPAELQSQLMARMAPGIDIFQVDDVPLKEPALQTQTISSTYVVTFLDPVDVSELREKVADLLAQETITRERGHGRKRKAYDLRPLVLSLEVIEDETAVQIMMDLQLMPSKTGRPDEVMMELGYDPLDMRIHRSKIFLESDLAETAVSE